MLLEMDADLHPEVRQNQLRELSCQDAKIMKRRLQLGQEKLDITQVSNYFNHLLFLDSDPFIKKKHRAFIKLMKDKQQAAILADEG